MDKISVRQNETFQLPVTTDDETLETVTITVWGDSGKIIDEYASFVDLEATIDAGIITEEVGIYHYSITLVYSDGTIDIMPDVNACEQCEFPEFEICPGGYDGGS